MFRIIILSHLYSSNTIHFDPLRNYLYKGIRACVKDNNLSLNYFYVKGSRHFFKYNVENINGCYGKFIAFNFEIKKTCIKKAFFILDSEKITLKPRNNKCEKLNISCVYENKWVCKNGNKSFEDEEF